MQNEPSIETMITQEKIPQMNLNPETNNQNRRKQKKNNAEMIKD